jgi:hypothetical protein
MYTVRLVNRAWRLASAAVFAYKTLTNFTKKIQIARHFHIRDFALPLGGRRCHIFPSATEGLRFRQRERGYFRTIRPARPPDRDGSSQRELVRALHRHVAPSQFPACPRKVCAKNKAHTTHSTLSK